MGNVNLILRLLYFVSHIASTVMHLLVRSIGMSKNYSWVIIIEAIRFIVIITVEG